MTLNEQVVAYLLNPTTQDILAGSGITRQVSALNFRWATVATVDPVEVTLDGDAEGESVPVAGVLAPVAAGQRVWCQLFGRRVIILGRPSGPVDTGWLPPEDLASGWTLDSGSNTPGFRQVGNVVYSRGRIYPPSTFTGGLTAIADLPTGIAPPAGNVSLGIGSNTTAVRMLLVVTQGQIQAYSSAASTAGFFLGGSYLTD